MAGKARANASDTNTPSRTPESTPDRDATEVVRLSVNIGADAADVLKEIAKRHGVSVTEAVRRAIGALKFVDDAQSRGASINLKEGDSVKEYVFWI